MHHKGTASPRYQEKIHNNNDDVDYDYALIKCSIINGFYYSYLLEIPTSISYRYYNLCIRFFFLIHTHLVYRHYSFSGASSVFVSRHLFYSSLSPQSNTRIQWIFQLNRRIVVQMVWSLEMQISALKCVSKIQPHWTASGLECCQYFFASFP